MPQEESVPILIHFLMGGTSGILATLIVHPADVMKTRLQVLPIHKRSLKTLAKGTLAKHGVAGFYSGISAAIFKQATYASVRFGQFRFCHEMYIREYNASPPVTINILNGMLSGATGAVVGTPGELICTRMQTDLLQKPEKRRNYKHVFEAISRICKEEGVIALWRGTTPTMYRAIVGNAAQLTSYTKARESLLPTLNDTVLLNFCSSLIAGAFTTLLSMPLDCVKTRLQHARRCEGSVSMLKRIISKGGILCLWKGTLSMYLRIGPHTMFSLMFLEYVEKQYKIIYFRSDSK